MGILDSVFGKKKEEKGKEAGRTEPADDATLFFKSGVQFYNGGDYGKAENEFRKVLGVNPEHGEAHYYLGKVYEYKIQSDDDFETMEEAMGEYQEAIRINPSYIDAHIRLGMLYLKGGFYEGAMRELGGALSINPDSPEAHAAMGEACYIMGTGREVKVEHPSGVGATSDFRGAKEYYKKALEEFNHAIKLDPSLADKLQPLIGKASQRVK